MLFRIFALVLLAFAVSTSAVAGQELDSRVLELYRDLKCPICNTSLEQSNTQIANDMKALIRQKLSEGESPDAIRAYFVDRYGESILVAPTKTTENLLAWIVPGLAILGGITLVSVLLRSIRRSPAAPEPAAEPIDPALSAVVERELADLR